MSKSRIIYKGNGYEAAIAGYKAASGPFLSVTRTVNGETRGKYIAGEQAEEWAGIIEGSPCAREQANLCRAIYQAAAA